MIQIFSHVSKYFQKKDKNKESSLKKKKERKRKRKRTPTHSPVKSRLQPWTVCGLFCLFFWLPSRHGLLHWSGCCPTSAACWPSPDPNNKVTLAGAKINISLQLPAPTADASLCVVGHEAERQHLFPLLLWSVSALSPSLFYSGKPSWGLCLNALYFEKCKVA